jgi:hypothetical protein
LEQFSNVIMSGVLHKKREKAGVVKLVQPWSRRYVVIRDHEIAWWATLDDAEKGRCPISRIDLCTNPVDVCPDATNLAGFILRPKVGKWTDCDFTDSDGCRLVAFQTSYPGAREQWMNCIASASDDAEAASRARPVSDNGEEHGFANHPEACQRHNGKLLVDLKDLRDPSAGIWSCCGGKADSIGCQ